MDILDFTRSVEVIDAHIHIESSMATPRQFARAAVPRGTGTVVADPHEVANVHGASGVRWMTRQCPQNEPPCKTARAPLSR